MNIVTWFDREWNEIPKIYRDCIQQVKDSLPKGWTHTLLPVGFYDTNSFVRSISDKVRCEALIDDPQAIWVDADTRVRKWFTPPDDKHVYVSTSPDGKFNGDVIYANKNVTTLKKILACYKPDDKPGWLQRVMNNEFKSELRPIPRECFCHLGLCHAQHLGEGMSWGTQECSVRRVKGELVLEWWKQ
jgi:hypothetical protein